MIIRAATFAVTFAVALAGIFLDVKDLKVKLALAGLAGASFLLAIFVEIQASRDAAFTKRSLSRLIQASTPSALFASAVRQIAIHQASDRGLSNCLALQREQQHDGYVVQLVFLDDTEQQAEGYFEFDHERLAQWSLLEESSLPREIVAEMFSRGPMPTADPLEHWDQLTAFIGAVGKGLYPNSVRDGAFGVSANIEQIEIGLPYPINAPTTPARRTKELLLANKPVPFLVFSKEDLSDLTARSNIEASRIVAGWLAAAWGTPTVLKPVT